MYTYSIFEHILSLPPTLPRSSLYPYQSNIMFFFSFTLSKKSKQKANKTKNNKIPTHTHTQKQKNANTTKKRGVHFVLANYFWPQRLPWTVGDAPTDTSLEKTDLSFPSRGVDCQELLVKSGTVCLLLLLWGGIFFWLELVQSLCMLYPSLRVHTCISSVVPRGHYFLGVIYHLNLLQYVPCRSLSLEERGLV